jgi:ATP dependent DNA ligase-like protein
MRPGNGTASSSGRASPPESISRSLGCGPVLRPEPTKNWPAMTHFEWLVRPQPLRRAYRRLPRRLVGRGRTLPASTTRGTPPSLEAPPPFRRHPDCSSSWSVRRDLRAGRGNLHYAAFDALCIEGKDLRPLLLTRRKQMLTRLIPATMTVLSQVFSIEGRGRDQFAAAERLDLEGIVAKQKADAYQPEMVRPLDRGSARAVPNCTFVALSIFTANTPGAQPKKVQRSRGGAGARGPAWFGWLCGGAAEEGEVLVGFGALAPLLPLEPNRFLIAAQPVTP